MTRDNISLLISNLMMRNIEGYYFTNKQQAIDKVLELIPEDCSVGVGNSQTLIHMNLSSLLSGRGNVVYDKNQGETKEAVTALKKKALLADWYITGTNAISLEGHIVNIDHSGNRVAAMLYGPEHVIVVIGTNKLEDSLEDAIKRARNIAAPANARRAGLNPPCTTVGQCLDCRSAERACNNLVVIEGQAVKGRMKVLIVEESLGY